MDTQLIEPQSPRLAGTDGHRLPVIGHLEELRKRLWICAGVILVASMGSLTFAGTLVDWLKRPAGSLLPRLAFFSPPEAFVAYLKVAVTAGLVLSLPIVLHELWAFIRPGLTRRERGAGLAFVWWGSALFAAGGAFAYWVLLPVSLTFLLEFGGGQLEPVISISRYLSFTTMVILACGVVFQWPLAVFLLAKLGVIRPQTLRRKWRHAVVGMVVVGAILTPTTDVATLFLMIVPMLALYEVSIWLAQLATPRRNRNG
ncbi:MAG: twin-arginine translocase subunit TatC [Candidatus Omnitrophica bacterium]|nr:twin-arginine translocase subunit TatC [Candidatus Omnitrophota bacterium]